MSHGFTEFSFPTNISQSSAWSLVATKSRQSGEIDSSNRVFFTFTQSIIAIGCDIPVSRKYFRAGYANVYKTNFVDPGSETFPNILLFTALLPVNDLRIIHIPQFADWQVSPLSLQIGLSNWVHDATIKLWEFNP